MKIRRVGDELFHADRLTDMTNLTVAFRHFEKAPKMCGIRLHLYSDIRSHGAIFY